MNGPPSVRTDPPLHPSLELTSDQIREAYMKLKPQDIPGYEWRQTKTGRWFKHKILSPEEAEKKK